MHPTLTRALAFGAAALAVAASAVALAGPAGAATVPAAKPATLVLDANAPLTKHVVLVGIGGLRWTDVSASRTPELWRLAGQGSDGSLVVSGVRPFTCPADGWLTLNGAARAVVPHPVGGPCPAGPRVAGGPAYVGLATPVPARVPAMGHLISFNAQYHYNPQWGLLAGAPGPGGCATAVGPGAALALASRSGQVAAYLPWPSVLGRSALARCPLTVIDLGNLPAHGSTAARAAAVQAADRRLAAIAAGLPAGTTLAVAGVGDDSAPHLRVIVVDGPGFAHGLLTADSTRQPGLVALTDLTPALLRWLHAPVPSAVVGSPLWVTSRGSLPGTVQTLNQQDTAAQVYRSTVTPFFQWTGFGYLALFALIGLTALGLRQQSRKEQRHQEQSREQQSRQQQSRQQQSRDRTRAAARAAGVWAASVPAGTFLASVVPWWTFTQPAAMLYSLAAAWATLIAAIALAGPWRRDPLGPPGVVATVTLAVIGLDMITGSHLVLDTPFGLSVLEAGRFYGLGNNALGIYGASGILCAAWLGAATARRGSRRAALAVMTAVAAFTVIAAGWPGFGAKVGGTIAMVPGFLVLLAAASNVKINLRRAALAAVSGLALVVVFALVSYFAGVSGHSDISGFAGKVLHGGAGSIVQRKISSNLRSLTANPFIPVIPAVLVALGAFLAWPARLRAGLLLRAFERIPLLRPALAAVWLISVLGWFAEDSGVTVPAAALPLVLPLVIAILCAVPPAERAGPPAAPAGRAIVNPGTRSA